ncbi:hypothetical protein ACQEVC_23095 [Plantactinospora sp. CA-294935]|uniref:hypothetical protein n=1 Tax=Plantactinospora sp. CA-294935 TaxID=3240012 RepID=UPI003D8FF39D
MTAVVIRTPRGTPGRTVVARRGVALVGLVGLVVPASACAGGETTGPASTPPASSATATAPTPSPTPAATDGCPVDAATLFAALKANRKLFAAVDAEISGVRDPACHRGYATATTIVPPERADPAWVVFEYDRDGATWTALGAGTDAVCTDLVPSDVIPRLPGCVGS